jgi:N-methylhydantoinase B
MVGGWGGRNGKDGSNATAPIFGVGLAVQPLEGQERLSPVVTTGHQILPDSGGPGRLRGGCGVEKGATLTDADGTVMSYCCDRARSVAWGMNGGLPSVPHGLWLNRGRADERFLGAVFSGVPIVSGDTFVRPSAGGGGYGDPLERDPEAVLEDVVEGHVTVGRALTDYGVAVRELDPDLARYELDPEQTALERARIRRERPGWLAEDPEQVAARYRAGELDVFDLVRQYGVILDWGTGELLPNTTSVFREMLQRRAVEHWEHEKEPAQGAR